MLVSDMLDPSNQITAGYNSYTVVTEDGRIYNGVLAALRWARDHGVTALRVRSDSELLVKQMKGVYRVKNPGLQPLFREAQQLAATIAEEGVRRKIVSRDVFVETVRRVLPVVSANTDQLSDKPVAGTMGKVLELASGSLTSRINGQNLPVLAEQLLRLVLARELNLTEAASVELASRKILAAA